MHKKTKWGEGRHLARALFQQDKVWVTAYSQVLRVEDMDLAHCLNTLLMLAEMDDLPTSTPVQDTKLYGALYARVYKALESEDLNIPVESLTTDPPTLNLKTDEELATFSETPEVDKEPVRFPADATMPSHIRDMLERASVEGAAVQVSYEKQDGSRTTRLLTIYSIEDKRHHFRPGTTSYVLARDAGDGRAVIDVHGGRGDQQVKTFRLDRIKSARRA